MPRNAQYLKIVTDEKVNDFVIINFGKCFKSIREALYSTLGEKKILEKLLNRLNFLATPY